MEAPRFVRELLRAAGASSEKTMRFGWYGDNGLGEHLISLILSGRKTATACPAYDPLEAAEGETVRLVDKGGVERGTIRVVKIEVRRMSEIDEALAWRLGTTLDAMRETAAFANSRAIGPEEEVRVTHFTVVGRA